jgi:hypothetical protein
VLVGLQLEDGPRIERKVKSEPDEHDLKLTVWELFDCPPWPLYLHIQNARDETQFEFRIGPHWTCTLRRQPVNTLKSKKGPRSVNGEAGDMTSATRKMREAQSLGKSSGAGTLRAAEQETTQRKDPEVTRHITVWCEAKTTNLIVRESMKKGDLIAWIVEQLGEPKGSYTLEVWNTRGVIIIIIHLLDLAPAGYLAASDNGA